MTLFYTSITAQVYQGLLIPDRKGRWGNAAPITQSSGLALDANGTSYWTHNDQGNATEVLYKFLPNNNNDNPVTIQKQVEILNTVNLDWEDLAQDDSGNIYICQVGKNCNANSDSTECPNRFVYKIHKVVMTSLNHPDSNAVTPVTYYFKYPLTGYDVNNCDADDTVFVNSEAVIWHNDALYIFTKNIWSKYTNNCGGWQTGYTYYFRLTLAPGSSMENPLIAEYKGKVNLRMTPTEGTNLYQVTAADISPDGSILAMTTYRRVWQFRNFTGDQFFNGTSVYIDYSGNGSDTIVRAYEGAAFHNNQYLMMGVDGINGRISGVNVDSIALWVRNTNTAGPGSMRNALAAASEGDTLRFRSTVINDTITVSTPLEINRDVNILQSPAQPVFLKGVATNVLSISTAADVRLSGIRIIGGNAMYQCIVNHGNLTMQDVLLMKH